MVDIEPEFENISLSSSQITATMIPKDNEIDSKLSHNRTRSYSSLQSDKDKDTGLLLRRVDETVHENTQNRQSIERGKQELIHNLEEKEKVKKSSDIDWQFWGEVMASKFKFTLRNDRLISQIMRK